MPAVTMDCLRKALDAVQPSFATTSASVMVRWKPPLIRRYEPVPEPATIGAAPAAVTVPEHVLVLEGKSRVARANRW